MKRVVRLTETDLKRIVMRVINENKLASALGSAAVLGIGLGIPILYLSYQNNVEIVDVNGESRTPENGEVLKGKITKMKPYGKLNAYKNPPGYDMIIKTSKGETIEFRVDYSEKVENVRVGDVIKVKYNDDTYFWDSSMDIQ
jgi:polyribonucleotide nucleotidyltransferase